MSPGQCAPSELPQSTQSGRSSFLKAVIPAKRSLDHFVRLQDQLLRNGQPDRLRGLQVDDELDLRSLFDGQVAGFRALEDLVDVRGSSIVMFRVVLSVAH